MTDIAVDLEVRETYVLARWFLAGEHLITFSYPLRGSVDLDIPDFAGETERERLTRQAIADLATFLAPGR